MSDTHIVVIKKVKYPVYHPYTARRSAARKDARIGHPAEKGLRKQHNAVYQKSLCRSHSVYLAKSCHMLDTLHITLIHVHFLCNKARLWDKMPEPQRKNDIICRKKQNFNYERIS